MKVIGISFKEKGKIYFFSPDNIEVKKGEAVIVETEKGMQYGFAETDIINEEEKKLLLPLKTVIRIATSKDEETVVKNKSNAVIALKKCEELIKKYDLKMKLIDADYTFDKKQLLFKFLSDERVDFRNLARDLAGLYRTRIELRQIGVRDKAKEIGGIGPCGRILCCNKFLYDFDTISINMAKNQSIALNPTKINGVCGRLLCCLGYEDEQYTQAKKRFPKINQSVEYKGTSGKVVSIDLLKEKFKIESQEQLIEIGIDESWK